jgi:hypothetical protein
VEHCCCCPRACCTVQRVAQVWMLAVDGAAFGSAREPRCESVSAFAPVRGHCHSINFEGRTCLLYNRIIGGVRPPHINIRHGGIVTWTRTHSMFRWTQQSTTWPSCPPAQAASSLKTLATTGPQASRFACHEQIDPRLTPRSHVLQSP